MKKNTTEHQKKRQAKSAGLPYSMSHRCSQSGKRWIRAWARRQHIDEMKSLAKRNDGS